MSNLPISSKYRSRPNDPVPDAERNDLSARLNSEFADGRIDQDTYDELLDRVFDAKSLGDLAPVVEVLGKPATHDQPAIVAQTPGGRPGELSEMRGPSNRTTMAMVGTVGGLAVLAVLIVTLLMLF